MFERLKRLLSPAARERELRERLEELRRRQPAPLLWLFGKTQSGKTTLIRYLTGAADAEIGEGFRPCTRFSRLYQFPTPEAPLVEFLDTRGLGEPDYDPAEDLAKFNDRAHAVIVTARVLDHAQETILPHLRRLRQAQPQRPVLLVLTCLHEAYPQQQHLEPYPFGPNATPDDRVPEDLRRSIAIQRDRFAELVDRSVAVDITRPEEGFHDSSYGGPAFRGALLELLPAAYRQTLILLDQATGELQDLFARRALPHILGYSSLAAAAGALPIPWLDVFILPGIQLQMIHDLAKLYGQPIDQTRLREFAGAIGTGLLIRQASRSALKFIPFVGSVVGAAVAGASTYAVGRAFCYYYSAVLKGHVPKADDLRRYYHEQLEKAERHWGRS
jgi:uncharacterized protein (DUF697 family)